MTPAGQSILYKLGDNYTLTKASGKECIMILRDKEENVVCVMDFCNNKISHLKEDKHLKVKENARKVLADFIVKNHYKITEEIARILKLSIWKKEGGEEEYLTPSQFLTLVKNAESPLNITVYGLSQRKLKFPDYLQGGVFKLKDAKVEKIEIGQESNINLDLRDNIYIRSLNIGKNFTGNINLSYSSIKNIRAKDNCRINLTIFSSLKCFDFEAGDVFSGNVVIKDSCFHHLKAGYYCYAKLNLSENWGRKEISIGDAFRGELNMDSVYAPNINIGKNCLGKIKITSRDNMQGAPRLNIGKAFDGELNMDASQVIEWVEIGPQSKGKISILGSPSLKVLKFDKMYSGTADVSASGIEYLRAKDGCSGNFVLMDCPHLSLVKLPVNKKSSVKIERQPLNIIADKDNIYYQYNVMELPNKYFTPWYKEAGDFLREHFFN